MVRRVSDLVAIGLTAIALSGCGGGSGFAPQLAPVKGTVKVNGSPVAGLVVSFEPQSKAQSKEKEVGLPSSGITDDSGTFELKYPNGKAGAVVGSNRVRIMNPMAGPNASAADAEPSPASSIIIPPSFNDMSETFFEVKPEPNTFDVDIKTKR